MESFVRVKLDDKLIESLEQILNLESTSYWSRKSSEASPSFPLSPESPSSPFENEPEVPEFYDEGFLNEVREESPTSAGSDAPPLPIYQKDGKRKRGRKPLRPFDPIKKKTEEKDKYWLRGFRAYMKTHYSSLRADMSSEDRTFWRDYLSSSGRPEKGNPYLSYGKKYKNFLFSRKTFSVLFREWFVKHGEEELTKKCERNSDLWFVFYDYGSKELLTYVPSSEDSPQSPEGQLVERGPPSADYDIAMVDEEIDSLLCDNQS